MLATWGSSSGINALLASSSLSLNFSNGSYTLGGVPYAVASVPGYSFTRSSGGYAETVAGNLAWFTGTRTNLALQSQALATSPWTTDIAGSVTVVNNAGTAPDNTLTATSLTFTTQFANRNQNINVTAGVTYAYSVWLKQISGNANLNLTIAYSSGPVISVLNPITITNAWAQYTVFFTVPVSITSMAVYVQDRNTSNFGTTYAWGAQVETATDTRITYPTAYIPTTTAAVSVDTPRITNKGYLSEEARTNLLSYSQDFSNSYWIKTNSIISSSTINAPDNTNTANRLSWSTSINPQVQTTSIAFASGSNLSFSVYGKAGTKSSLTMILSFDGSNYVTQPFDLTTGLAGSPSVLGTKYTSVVSKITAATNGWYRCTVSVSTNTLTSTSTGFRADTSVGSGDYINIWGAQFEVGAFATSYIPTTTAAATRAADILKFTSISSWYNQTAGTLAVTADASANSFTTYVAATNGVTAQNSVHIDNDTGNMRAVYYSGSAAVATLVLGAIGTVGALTKIATAYAVNDFSASRNGGAAVTNSFGALPVSISQLNVGNDPAGVSTQYVDGYIKNVLYYNTRLSNAQLQAITA